MIVNRIEATYYDQVPANVDVLTTLGADGVLYRDKKWPAPKVEVISTHGAGDMLLGSLAARMTDGCSVEEAIPFAQATAAWHISNEAAVRDATDSQTLIKMIVRQLKR